MDSGHLTFLGVYEKQFIAPAHPARNSLSGGCEKGEHRVGHADRDPSSNFRNQGACRRFCGPGFELRQGHGQQPQESSKPQTGSVVMSSSWQALRGRGISMVSIRGLPWADADGAASESPITHGRLLQLP